MKKHFLSGLILSSLFFAHPVFSTVIELKDGSKISGQVLSMSDGVYKIYSESVGVLKIPQSKVRTIHEDNASLSRSKTTAKHSSTAKSPDMENIQKKILSDEQMQKSILSLQADPQIQAILKDEALMKAIQAQDFNALTSNPKIIELMNNAKIGELTRQLK